jgi:membrane-bound metal-dependent hydrolase YbcI (DUF457 family)
MMPFAGHAGLALIVSSLTGLNPLLVVIGSLIPDFDSILSFFGASLSKVHRKGTHSLLFFIVLLFSSIFIPLLLPISIGVIVHLVADLDHWGLPLFYPFSRKRYSVLKVDQRNKHESVGGYLKDFFTKHYLKFLGEVTLLIVGLFLTWGYWMNFFNNLLP